MKTRRAYTFVEMITVIAIMVILAAVAISVQLGNGKMAEQSAADAPIYGVMRTVGNAVLNYWKGTGRKPCVIEDAVDFLFETDRNLTFYDSPYGEGKRVYFCVAINCDNETGFRNTKCAPDDSCRKVQEEQKACVYAYTDGKTNFRQRWVILCDSPDKSSSCNVIKIPFSDLDILHLRGGLVPLKGKTLSEDQNVAENG